MTIDAEIICRREPYGDVCKWKGGNVAKIFADHIQGQLRSGDVVERGRLKLRIVAYPLFSDSGTYCDSAAVMLESPNAQLFWLYREHAERIVRIAANIETRVWGAARAFLLKPLPEGSRLRFAGWLADVLL